MTTAVAIVVDDQVVAMSEDPSSVRIAAGMIAGEAPVEHRAVLVPIERGRQEACRLIAHGAEAL